MRVLFITHYTSMYGANKSMLQLIIELKNNYKVKPIVLLPDNGELVENLKKENIEYIVSKFYCWVYQDNKIDFFKTIIKKLLNNFYEIRLTKLIKNKNIDIVHTNSSVIDMGARIAKNLNKKHIWHIREYGYEDYNLKYLIGYKKACQFFEKNSTKIIAISESISRKYTKLIDNSKVRVIYNGISSIDVKEKNINKTTTNFIIVGVIFENKNQFEAIKAFKILKEKYNKRNIKLTLVGTGDNEYIKQIKNYINQNMLEDYVEFLGYREDISEILSRMDIGILTSKKEAFGRVTVEYMLNSMPVIGTNTGATSEIIGDKVTGFLYELGNEWQLAEYMNELIENSKLRKSMGEKSKERALQKFTSVKNAENIYCLYKEMIKN